MPRQARPRRAKRQCSHKSKWNEHCAPTFFLSFFLFSFWKVLTSLLLFDCFDRSSRRSSKSTIDKHFKLRKLRKKSLIDKPIVVQSVKLGGRNKGVKHRSSSTSSNSSKRNCSSYFLRPLSRRDYSLNQCTFTI